VHLINGEESRFRNVILNECKSFVFICQVIKCQVDALQRPKWQECLFHRVLTDVEVYTANVDSTTSHPHTSTIQWRRQRSKGARSFQGQKILQPGHPDALFPQEKLTTFFWLSPSKHRSPTPFHRQAHKVVRYGTIFIFCSHYYRCKTIRRARQGRARAWAARSLDLARPGVAPPLVQSCCKMLDYNRRQDNTTSPQSDWWCRIISAIYQLDQLLQTVSCVLNFPKILWFGTFMILLSSYEQNSISFKQICDFGRAATSHRSATDAKTGDLLYPNQ